jgi:hypothetical protein
MRLQLPNKDLVVIGFWTDWGYLNDVLANALDAGGFNSVTVINRADAAELEAKAPKLWAMLNAGTVTFLHVQGSSTEALEEQCARPLVDKAFGDSMISSATPFIRV